MKKTKLIAGSLVLGLAVVMIGAGSQVWAYRGDPTARGEDCAPERHSAMEQAFGSLDYEAWVELMQERGRVTEVITEENFDRFAEMHRLKTEGDIDGAQAIAQELGLGQRSGNGEGRGMGHGKEAGFRHGKNLNR
jgi:hypothetical protein